MQEKDRPRIVLVLGGVRSGKSGFAQRLVERAAKQHGPVTFIATAERRDDLEMAAKIDRHRADRPAEWGTVEEPRELGTELRGAAAQTVWIDCLTLFAANILESGRASAYVEDFCTALADFAGHVIVVSNEVGSGVVPEYALGRQFRDLLGEINQRVAAIADVVVMMVAGLPLALKGSLAELETPQ